MPQHFEVTFSSHVVLRPPPRNGDRADQRGAGRWGGEWGEGGCSSTATPPPLPSTTHPHPQHPSYAHLTSELSSCLFHADLSPFPPYLHTPPLLRGEGSFPFSTPPPNLPPPNPLTPADFIGSRLLDLLCLVCCCCCSSSPAGQKAPGRAFRSKSREPLRSNPRRLCD